MFHLAANVKIVLNSTLIVMNKHIHHGPLLENCGDAQQKRELHTDGLE